MTSFGRNGPRVWERNFIPVQDRVKRGGFKKTGYCGKAERQRQTVVSLSMRQTVPMLRFKTYPPLTPVPPAAGRGLVTNSSAKPSETSLSSPRQETYKRYLSPPCQEMYQLLKRYVKDTRKIRCRMLQRSQPQGAIRDGGQDEKGNLLHLFSQVRDIYFWLIYNYRIFGGLTWVGAVPPSSSLGESGTFRKRILFLSISKQIKVFLVIEVCQHIGDGTPIFISLLRVICLTGLYT